VLRLLSAFVCLHLPSRTPHQRLVLLVAIEARTYCVDLLCWAHLRNLFIGEGAKEEKAYLKTKLKVLYCTALHCTVLYCSAAVLCTRHTLRQVLPIVPKAKRRKLDGDETGMFNRLHKTASDALMTMIRAKRLYFRRQYDGDEQDQSLMRSARRKVQADKGREKAEHTAMEQAQYRVLERITSKEELQSVLASPAFEKSKGKKEALLKDQLLIRYVGFPREAVPKKSWSCKKEGRTGSVEELKVTLEELLEGEIATPLAWDRQSFHSWVGQSPPSGRCSMKQCSRRLLVA
jgi:hypothetical protein